MRSADNLTSLITQELKDKRKNAPPPPPRRTAPPRKKEQNAFVLPPKSEEYKNKKTLVLDLDETLVHSSFQVGSQPADIALPVTLDGRQHTIYVLVRPGTHDLLRTLAPLYEIVLFTASQPIYAQPLIDILDVDDVCSHRLYREHCTYYQGMYIKDLSKLGRDLKEVIIVDNQPNSYMLHPENAIPTISWYEDKADKELYDLIHLL